LNILFAILSSFTQKVSLTDSSVIENLAGGVLGGFIIFVIVFLTKEKGMGGGDILVLALIGFVLGYEKVIISFLLSIYLALFASIPLIIKKKSYKDIQIPFVPFLVFGGMIAFVFGLRLEVLVLFKI
jgi:prepilin signal peptidase PulO-like enzyme (type II secretory pathway)